LTSHVPDWCSWKLSCFKRNVERFNLSMWLPPGFVTNSWHGSVNGPIRCRRTPLLWAVGSNLNNSSAQLGQHSTVCKNFRTPLILNCICLESQCSPRAGEIENAVGGWAYAAARVREWSPIAWGTTFSGSDLVASFRILIQLRGHEGCTEWDSADSTGLDRNVSHLQYPENSKPWAQSYEQTTETAEQGSKEGLIILSLDWIRPCFALS